MLRIKRRAPIAILVASAVVVLAGCGDSRTPVPGIETPIPPIGLRTLHFRSGGVSLKAPANWSVAAGHGRLVAVVSSGSAVVALWRYPSSAAAPNGRAALRQAEHKLVLAAKARDPRLQLISSTVKMLAAEPVVELTALEQIAGHSREVTSSHVFAGRAEIVLDEYAPKPLFAAVDRSVFAPIRRSLLIKGGAIGSRP